MRKYIVNGREFFQGYWIVQVRRQSDTSMFSRPAGWRAYRDAHSNKDEDIVAEYKTKRELKKFIEILKADYKIVIG